MPKELLERHEEAKPDGHHPQRYEEKPSPYRDPQAVMNLVGRAEIGAIAAEVRARLERVVAAL